MWKQRNSISSMAVDLFLRATNCCTVQISGGRPAQRRRAAGLWQLPQRTRSVRSRRAIVHAHATKGSILSRLQQLPTRHSCGNSGCSCAVLSDASLRVKIREAATSLLWGRVEVAATRYIECKSAARRLGAWLVLARPHPLTQLSQGTQPDTLCFQPI